MGAICLASLVIRRWFVVVRYYELTIICHINEFEFKGVIAEMTYREKITKAKESRITVPENILDKNIVGIYKFFKVKGNEKFCFYIGKSTNIAYRLFGSSSGHIYMYINNNSSSNAVPSKIKEYLNADYDIKVEIIEVDYSDDSFSKAAHRLALVELQEIVKCQEKGQCKIQVPEGVGTSEETFWEKNYNTNSNL